MRWPFLAISWSVWLRGADAGEIGAPVFGEALLGYAERQSMAGYAVLRDAVPAAVRDGDPRFLASRFESYISCRQLAWRDASGEAYAGALIASGIKKRSVS